jgi:hypothetical protein
MVIAGIIRQVNPRGPAERIRASAYDGFTPARPDRGRRISFDLQENPS